IVPRPEAPLPRALSSAVLRALPRLEAVLAGLAAQYRFRLVTSFRDLPAGVRTVLLEGSGEQEVEFEHGSRTIRRPFAGLLALARGAATLSGGEGQRIRLATQIGSRLVGVLYILDEPSIGLHQRDNARLLATLRQLRDLGNTVVVVEHDRDTILAADHVIDMGPGAGVHGGRVVAAGPPAAIMADPASLTGRYLAGTEEVPVPR